jgi:hypothetical protein
MKVAWFQWGGAACAAALALLMGGPVRAADDGNGVQVAAEELDKRTKQAEDAAQSKGMSDSAVRVLMTYAFSIIPDDPPGPDGKRVKVDKSDPNKFLIPSEDARRVIRCATRSAYAQVCQLPELAEANFQALIKGEEAKKIWSREQLLMINALHIFAVSYFTGNIRITAAPNGGEGAQAPAPGGGAAAVAKSDGAVESADEGAQAPAPDGGATAVAKTDGAAESADQSAQSPEVVEAEPPKCPPEQKQKVMNAIKAYVQSAQVAAPKGSE